MKKHKFLLFFLLVSFATIIVKNYFLLPRPFADNDEGIYLNTFLLVSKGYKLYQEVFFSQLPGFFMLVYPVFRIFGQTLFAARSVIFIWSILGLLGVVWLFKELEKPLLAPVAILILNLIPKYYLQTVTFQSDALVLSLSVICIAALIRFSKQNKIVWLLISLIYFCFAFLTKLDITLSPIILFFLYKHFRKKSPEYSDMLLIFLIPISIFFTTLMNYDGKAIIDNVFNLRLLAAKVYPIAPLNLWKYLREDAFLFFLTIVFLIQLSVNIFFKKISKNTKLIVAWFFLTLLFILFFRPIFPHHLSMLVIPLTIAALLLLSDFYKIENNYFFIVFVCLVLLVANILSIKKTVTKSNRDEDAVIGYIQKYSEKNDFIITDEAKLYSQSQRLPPPFLSDISTVRILSGSINAVNFRREVLQYKPKLIILWNGRLKQLEGLNRILTDLGYKNSIQPGKDKAIYSN